MAARQAVRARGSLKWVVSSVTEISSIGGQVALADGGDDLLHQHFGRRGAGGDADGLHALEPAPVDLRRALHQVGAAGSRRTRATSTRRCELEEFGAPITSTQVGPRRDHLHRRLAVGGGVADVFLARPVDLGKAPAQHVDDADRCRRSTAWSA